MSQKQTRKTAFLETERLELSCIRLDLLAVKALIANRRQVFNNETAPVRKRTPFDFGAATYKGRTLLVGEGNFSFSSSLVQQFPKSASNIYATCQAKLTDVSDGVLSVSQALTKAGAFVGFSVDGTKLYRNFPSRFLSTIVFQFPNAGSRASSNGLTTSHQLICAFLRSAETVLAIGGQIVITIVDTHYYHGVFDLKRAADLAGFKVESAHPFYRSHYAGYQHSNSGPTPSALQAYRSCTTYVFVRSPILKA
jgi:hypothetical protein